MTKDTAGRGTLNEARYRREFALRGHTHTRFRKRPAAEVWLRETKRRDWSLDCHEGDAERSELPSKTEGTSRNQNPNIYTPEESSQLRSGDHR